MYIIYLVQHRRHLAIERNAMQQCDGALEGSRSQMLPVGQNDCTGAHHTRIDQSVDLLESIYHIALHIKKNIKHCDYNINNSNTPQL